jgi:hypothetical protein
VERPELDVGEVLREREVGESAQQRGPRDAHLHAGQRRAKTVVYAVTEGKVSRRATADVQHVGCVDEFGITIS